MAISKELLELNGFTPGIANPCLFIRGNMCLIPHPSKKDDRWNEYHFKNGEKSISITTPAKLKKLVEVYFGSKFKPLPK